MENTFYLFPCLWIFHDKWVAWTHWMSSSFRFFHLPFLYFSGVDISQLCICGCALVICACTELCLCKCVSWSFASPPTILFFPEYKNSPPPQAKESVAEKKDRSSTRTHTSTHAYKHIHTHAQNHSSAPLPRPWLNLWPNSSPSPCPSSSSSSIPLGSTIWLHYKQVTELSNGGGA